MTAYESPGGTVSMPIKRIGSGRADYEIDLNFNYSGGKYEWTTQKDPFSGVVGANELDFVRLDDETEKSRSDITDLFSKLPKDAVDLLARLDEDTLDKYIHITKTSGIGMNTE